MKQFGLIITASLLSACASLPQTQPQKAANPGSQLSPRTLSPGDCGLFVWSADRAKRFILFTGAGGAGAVWHDGTGEQALTPGGVQAGQLSPKQTFTSETAALSLDLRAPQVIAGGTRYKAGVLKLAPKDKGGLGFETVMPVVGLASCPA